MGRFFKKFRQNIREKIEEAIGDAIGADGGGFIGNQEEAQNEFEDKKPDSMRGKDIRMISGCEDSQTSADVFNVVDFQLPDPAGRAGGACTSALLRILYKDEHIPEDTLSFTQVLELMREDLSEEGYRQIPQLTSLNKIDVETDFELVPHTATGVRRAVMIGINYVGQDGELRGCHNDVLNMKKYLMDVHGFEEENIVILMDDGVHDEPTRENMIEAYQQIVDESEDGDAVFLHYSGHGTKLVDGSGDEEDGYDEALVPLDYDEAGMLLDDDLFEILIEPLAEGVHMVSLMDCCHSGTILDLPYIFKPNDDGSMPHAMKLDDTINLDGLVEQFGGQALGLLVNFVAESF
mmetsp:Transcript_9759/g.23001  ORF Transcript_9759/g.23001 Transcript_9759/m.23001 type:complete len:349 (+) Transcript_9759:123-1169(+)|eukprot:CAMPEP_0201116762 /NCGR_PEP_ID=MMETSP0850-20130426/941_1 /ASSEMBLY_ACC=CAM_ASM_000622 /TAXON_ID=183588 /ORGANISM="Pseudo-nitzschia fraudulenta, Strain WWA7" /LENGTH=348 /DNA_ID=CAMNT_0047380931 /DNA_START=85 /DNA_END=1131 /DNA_ORIENTATION=+